MKKRTTKKAFDHSGSPFDDFLEEEGIRAEVEAVAAKRVLAWELAKLMKRKGKTKQAMAKALGTSRSQVDRLLDPNNTTVSLLSISRVARALGERVIVSVRP
jgi:antitoxin HicB